MKTAMELMWSAESVAGCRAQLAEGDSRLAAYVEDVRRQADLYLGATSLVYAVKDGRLLHVAQDCLRRVYALGVVWRLTQESRYADALTHLLQDICAFPDWHFEHPLDMAEMTHAAAIGYDWLRAELSEEARERLGAAIQCFALDPARAAFDSAAGPQWMNEILGEFNWNLVCNGGLIIGACAMHSTDAVRSKALIQQCVEAMQPALKHFAPDGLWPEGADYTRYAIMYVCYAASALQSTLGHDFGLSDTPGFSGAGRAAALTLAPSGTPMQFADVGEKWITRQAFWPYFWFASNLGDTLCAEEGHADIGRVGEPTPEHIMWYVDLPVPELRPLDMYLDGALGVACFRSAWQNSQAAWVYIKTGCNRVNHGHLDLGSFELELAGVRWAVDLGTDSYELPGNWDRHSDDGKRWTYFRYASTGHNVLLVNGLNQRLDGRAAFTQYEARDKAVSASVDLTSAYAPPVEAYTRSLVLLRPVDRVTVRDDIRLDGEAVLEWNMLTRAQIAVNGSRAILRQDGRELFVTATGIDGVWTVISAEQEPPQAPNTGVWRLVYRMQCSAGDVNLRIHMEASS